MKKSLWGHALFLASKMDPKTHASILTRFPFIISLEFKSEAPVAEEMLDRVVCSCKQFSFQMCLESGDGSGTYRNWRQRVPDSWCRDTECVGLVTVMTALSED